MKPRSSPEIVAARRAYITQHYLTMTNGEMALVLGMTTHHVCTMVNRAGLKRPPANLRNSVWTDLLLAQLDTLYAITKTRELAELMGIPARLITGEAQKRGLSKDKDLWRQWNSESNRATYMQRKAARPPQHQQLSLKAPPPMTVRQREKMAAERMTYPEGALPWRAQSALNPVWIPPDLSYRGQVLRNA